MSMSHLSLTPSYFSCSYFAPSHRASNLFVSNFFLRHYQPHFSVFLTPCPTQLTFLSLLAVLLISPCLPALSLPFLHLPYC